MADSCVLMGKKFCSCYRLVESWCVSGLNLQVIDVASKPVIEIGICNGSSFKVFHAIIHHLLSICHISVTLNMTENPKKMFRVGDEKPN